MAGTVASLQFVASIEKNLTMRDGRLVTVRSMHPTDVESSYEFFCGLAEEDRKYLRVDVTRRRMVERRTTELDRSRIERLVVVHDDEIVADGALHLEGHGWGDNVAGLAAIRPWNATHERTFSSRVPIPGRSHHRAADASSDWCAPHYEAPWFQRGVSDSGTRS